MRKRFVVPKVFSTFATNRWRKPQRRYWRDIWKIINKRLLLFGKALRIYQIQNEVQPERISRKRLCVRHGRDLSGLTGFGRAFRAWISVHAFLCSNEDRLRR